jgi:hypothetical protein
VFFFARSWFGLGNNVGLQYSLSVVFVGRTLFYLSLIVSSEFSFQSPMLIDSVLMIQGLFFLQNQSKLQL